MNLENQDYWVSLIGMSTCKFFLLQGLHQGPGHGYALLERMRSYTHGNCTASYGAIYPILKKLADGDLALIRYENVGNRKRKVYELTQRGEKAYQEALEAWEVVLPYLSRAVEEDLH
jgi:PadR family transcriptional regulator PadR